MSEAELSWFRRPSADQPGTVNAVYELLDRRVIAGGADDPVLDTDGTPVHCARLLEDVAVLGGVLRAHGVAPGTPVAWRGPVDRHGVTALLALARIGGQVSLDEDADVAIHADGIGEADWDLALKAGRTDPAPVVELRPDAPWHGQVTVRHLALALRDLEAPTTPAALVDVLLASTIVG